MIGTTLSRYHLLEHIGAGGMGVVYRARDQHLARDVAVKVLPQGLLADETARRRFRKEALALSQLNHPNIATVHDFDTHEGVDFLVMELIPGERLDEKVGGGALPEGETLRLGLALAQGLAAAHEQGVVHRDLKPGNIRVTPDGRPKILDFGLALLSRPAGDLSGSLTAADTHTVTGTLPYMAPEVLRGEKADERSDLYALGCVLYEMATGGRPHAEDSAAQLLYAVLHKAPKPPRAVNPAISAALEKVILKAMEKDPSRRHASARQLASALERLSPAAGAVVGPARPVRRRRWVLTTAAVLVVVLLGAVLQRWGQRRAPEPHAHRFKSLAVLPLANLSGDPSQDYFADGMTEALTSNLAQLGALRVISRTSARHYKGTGKSVPEIARELNVDAVIEGSVIRVGNKVRITAQLIHAATDEHLWAHTYDREMQDVLALQSEVAQAIAQEIQVRLTPQERTRLASAATVNPEAYDLYLQGRHFFGRWSEQGGRMAIELFQQALAKDPKFAPAYSGIADGYMLLGTLASAMPAREALEKAKAAAEQALALDDGLAEAHASLGYLRLLYDWDVKGSEKEFRRSLEIYPHQTTGLVGLALVLAAQGKVEEAATAGGRGYELDPLSVGTAWQYGAVLFYARRYDECINVSRRTLELDSTFVSVLWTLASSYEEKGMFAEAVAVESKARVLLGAPPGVIEMMEGAYRTGGIDGYRRAKIEEGKLQGDALAQVVAQLYARLGDRDRAFEWLERAYRAHIQRMAWIKVEPALDGLRSDPRYKDLVRRMGLRS